MVVFSLFLFCSSFSFYFFQKDKLKVRRVLGHQVLIRDGYDHFELQNKEGEFLSYINEKRFNWYLKKDLATRVDEKIIRLKFDAGGKGNKGDLYYEQKQENICVCCGTNDNYTKHHVIPDEFRRNFPLNLKSHHSHDLVLLCAKCHEDYETIAMDFKKEISIKYNVPMGGLGRVEDIELKKIQKDAAAILKNKENPKFPKERREMMTKSIKEYLKKDILNDEDIQNLINSPTVDNSKYLTFGECIVEKVAGKEKDVEKIEEFSIMWRQHFIDTMKPKHLNPYWNPKRNLQRKEKLEIN